MSSTINHRGELPFKEDFPERTISADETFDPAALVGSLVRHKLLSEEEAAEALRTFY